MNHSWQPIRDYTVDPEKLPQLELRTLENVWREQRDRLQGLDAFQKFNEKLKREWAIETGLIERLYVLDRGITQLLIEHGIDASLIPHNAARNPEIVVSMINDHESVVDGIFEFIKGERSLSTSYIKDIHRRFTYHQDTVNAIDILGKPIQVKLISGDYKQQPNNPQRPNGEVHEYCPPVQVSSEMDRLIAMHLDHERNGVQPEVEAAWLHHRFTQIHPFQDGNGRVARALATLIFVKSGWFPLVVRDKERSIYIEALEAADAGDLGQLVEYFSRLQKEEFIRALSIARDVLQSARAEDAILAVRRELQKRKESLVKEWQAARDIATSLHEFADRRLREIAETMKKQMQGLIVNATFFTTGASHGADNDHYYRFQIVQTAKELGYFANTHTYRSWVRLVMKNSDQSELLISFHGIGPEYQGVLACSSCWFQRVETEEGEREIGAIKPVTNSVLQINYREPMQQAQDRFSPWLEESIIRAIELWRISTL